MNVRSLFAAVLLASLLTGCRMNLGPLAFLYVDPADDSLVATVDVVQLSGRMVDGGLLVTVTHAGPIEDSSSGFVEIDVDGDASTGFDWVLGNASAACGATAAGVDLALEWVIGSSIDPFVSVWNDGDTYAMQLDPPEIVGHGYRLFIPDTVLADVPGVALRGEARAQAVFGGGGYADCVPGGAPIDN